MDKDFNVQEEQTEYLYTRKPTIKTTLLPGDNSNSLQITVPE
jgi:hypothetical protein